MLRILLIMPDARMHTLRFGTFVLSMREAPLTLTTLAALVPDPDIKWQLVDGSVECIPLHAKADLVGISVITGTAPEAYRLADHYRTRDIPVVLGGVHVTLCPEEAAAHADAIVMGMAENSWPQLVRDFRAGQMRAIYKAPPPADAWLPEIPTPRRDLHSWHRYTMPNTVQATRGCKKSCDFCSVPTIWPRYYKRPVSDVIADIRSLRGRYFVFNDVNLTDDREYAMELFGALAKLGKRWGALTTVDVADDPELLDLMAHSGCMYLLIGFESFNQGNLRFIRKGFNDSTRYGLAMEALHRRRISAQGCFVFGFDHDDESVFASTVQQVLDLKIDIPRYSLYTPYPGTTLFKRLLAENRILSLNWRDYDTMHVVIRPARMSPETLYDGFKWAYRETFAIRNVLRRTARADATAVINFLGNLTYCRFVRRLYTDPRFAAPHSANTPGRALIEAGNPIAEAVTCRA